MWCDAPPPEEVTSLESHASFFITLVWSWEKLQIAPLIFFWGGRGGGGEGVNWPFWKVSISSVVMNIIYVWLQRAQIRKAGKSFNSRHWFLRHNRGSHATNQYLQPDKLFIAGDSRLFGEINLSPTSLTTFLFWQFLFVLFELCVKTTLSAGHFYVLKDIFLKNGVTTSVQQWQMKENSVVLCCVSIAILLSPHVTPLCARLTA